MPHFTEQSGLTHMATALQAKYTAECCFSDGFIDDLSIITKKGHCGAGLYSRKEAEGTKT